MKMNYKKQAAPFIISGILCVLLAVGATRIPQDLNYAIGFGGPGLYLWGCFKRGVKL